MPLQAVEPESVHCTYRLRKLMQNLQQSVGIIVTPETKTELRNKKNNHTVHYIICRKTFIENTLCPLILTKSSCTIPFSFDQETLMPFLHYTLQVWPRVTYALLALYPSILTKHHLCPSCTITTIFNTNHISSPPCKAATVGHLLLSWWGFTVSFSFLFLFTYPVRLNVATQKLYAISHEHPPVLWQVFFGISSDLTHTCIWDRHY